MKSICLENRINARPKFKASEKILLINNYKMLIVEHLKICPKNI